MAGILAAFTCGLVFAFGLVAGGMTQPSKVVGFLDVTGAWDPSLALVMGGALGTHALLRRFVLARPRPLLAPAFCVPTRSDLDARLVAGAAIFGLGWGLGGFCPGPAIVALGGAMPAALVVVPAMLAGMLLHDRFRTRSGPPKGGLAYTTQSLVRSSCSQALLANLAAVVVTRDCGPANSRET